ncbi:5-hydroxytryptamine receptor 3A-like [Pungitius pungitius]|uniref:5-hydroxytryptamine receptor 3A-like n=1 Tax=Pungitius pungitius TaxID=134920 RepID=UPI002E105BF2
MLMDKEYLSQPQTENCTLQIFVRFLEYQTVEVDTKSLVLISRLLASIEWTDPDLAWNASLYQHDEVILPVDKIWVPELHVTNGITTEMSHASPDLLAYSNGTVMHDVIINAQVICKVNLFNYPFASDKCPVAIQGWSGRTGCGTHLVFDQLKPILGSSGDWSTDNATLQRQRSDRNYILVSLSVKSTGPFMTLVLPSILIIIADVASFALPLGGERNGFKVTLVLSFTMFLIILNDELPGDGECRPIIRLYFCSCLVILVVSMLWSMVMTRVFAEGRIVLFRRSKRPASGNVGGGNVGGGKAGGGKATKDEGVKAEVGVDGGVKDDGQMLRKVVNFLEALDAKTQESYRNQMFASNLDHKFFVFYLVASSVYLIAMNVVMAVYPCSLDHFQFWYN